MTYRKAPKEDRATATDNNQKKIGKDWTCNNRHVLADRRTHRQTDIHHSTPLLYSDKSTYRHECIGNESVPIQLAQCWFPGLAIYNTKI